MEENWKRGGRQLREPPGAVSTNSHVRGLACGQTRGREARSGPAGPLLGGECGPYRTRAPQGCRASLWGPHRTQHGLVTLFTMESQYPAYRAGHCRPSPSRWKLLFCAHRYRFPGLRNSTCDSSHFGVKLTPLPINSSMGTNEHYGNICRGITDSIAHLSLLLNNDFIDHH